MMNAHLEWPKDKIKNHLKDSGENLKEEHDTESAHQKNSSKGKASNLFKNFTSKIMPKKTQKEPRLDKVEEGQTNEDMKDNQDENDGKSCNSSEVVYAKLWMHQNSNSKDRSKIKERPDTEYAEIIGTVPESKMEKIAYES